MNTQFIPKKKEVIKPFLFIFIFLVVGFFFGSLLQVNLEVESNKVSAMDILLNNALIGVVLVFLTSLVAYPIILFNSFFLGLNIYFGIEIFGVYKTFMTLIFHTPIEILGWILCIVASKRVKDFYTDMFRKNINQKSLRAIFILLITMVIVYIIAAIIEHYIFEYMGGYRWLH
ncbi:stage II sporulation protein M [Bacillus thuringiensis]|uniref:stage II sporulation protein M n=1 Tax=Bacillus thuringiensis TaxID=1428 RepID=UPI0031454881